MKNFHVLYQLKNMILRTPFSYGHYRTLKAYKDPAYNFERDKHPVRKKHYGKEGWKTQVDNNFQYRDYASYEEYVTHQSQKFEEILKGAGGFGNRDILEYRKRFYRRFRYLSGMLDTSATILCLGARQGTEVEVLWDLGYKNAIGLDLNPGPENPYVRKGDFMALDYPDNSVDMIYTNCVDHAFDLEKFFKEHARVIKPGGYAIYDIGALDLGLGVFEAVNWSSPDSVLLQAFQHYKNIYKVETDRNWKWFCLQK
jgi:SAM-dependent methyltransferase